jgi:copper chaperone NosL
VSPARRADHEPKEENPMRTAEKYILLFLLLPLFLSLSLQAAAADRKPMEIKKNDKCRVCGMLVSAYPQWVAEIVFNDGSYATFDGPKDMFRYFLNIAKFDPSRKQSDIAAIFVTEYYTTLMKDAHVVFFVKGSDVNGPMGAELVPLETLDKAKVFMKDHRGKKILKFDEVRMEDLK